MSEEASIDVSKIGEIGSAPPAAPAPPQTAEYEHCGECGAPVDRDQRYCVSCGAHRQHVTDPAARYLGDAAVTRTGGSSSTSRRSRWTFGLAHALLLALIPVALAVGVVVGRSSNNDDASLIRALSHTQTQASTSAAAQTRSTAAASSKRRAQHKRGSHHHTASQNASSGQTGFKHTNAPSDVNSTPSTAQKKQGAAIVNKLQHTTGTSFLNQLPSQVSVP